MDDFEELLRRYQPAAPPPDLRDRIADAMRTPGWTFREWIPAAVAAAVVIFFYAMSSGAWTQIARNIGIDEAHDAAVSRLMESLDGSDLDRAEAERIVDLEELNSRTAYERAERPGEGVTGHD